MKYLLDTHTMIWAITDPVKLSSAAKEAIENTTSQVHVSAVSFWEIALKHAKGTLTINVTEPDILLKGCKETGFNFLSLDAETALSSYNLQGSFHKDPFDRMLIWTALKNNFTFITKDKDIKLYQTMGLKTVW
jgi:PIN domain nuclease of toxin-antitoxin system